MRSLSSDRDLYRNFEELMEITKEEWVAIKNDTTRSKSLGLGINELIIIESGREKCQCYRALVVLGKMLVVLALLMVATLVLTIEMSPRFLGFIFPALLVIAILLLTIATAIHRVKRRLNLIHLEFLVDPY